MEQTGLGRWTQGSAIQLPYDTRHDSIWEYAAAMQAGSVDFTWVLRGRCPVCGGRGHLGRLSPYCGVGWPRGIAPPGLPQIRTCGTPASGSSCYGFAALQVTEWTTRGGGSG